MYSRPMWSERSVPRWEEGEDGVSANALYDEHLVGGAHPDDRDALLLAEHRQRWVEGEEGEGS